MMTNFSEMQSSASMLFTAYASLAASIMLIRTMANDLIPAPLRSYIESIIRYFFTLPSSKLTIAIDEQAGMTRNEVYDAAEVFLRTKISPKAERFKVSKSPKQKNLNLSVEKNDVITDTFEGLELSWKFVTIEPSNKFSSEKNLFELSFDKKFKEKVLAEYLPFVLAKAKEIKDADSAVKLYTRDCPSYDDEDGGNGVWGSINLDHPSTFETLAMDPNMKKGVVDDLDRFLRRREYYKKVGKAWKRGYLLFGPPGTGKSSLIAAMANYLKFDIYDLELSSLYSNADLRRVLISTNNRSIIVIEDIDCSVQTHDRELDDGQLSESKLTLSGLLNFIDGLWSSCGDERIIIFTTNHKDRLDPALLRPGRMDMHIHMSYLTPQGFRVLASNYHEIMDNHSRFEEIDGLIESSNVTPAEIAEELLRSEDSDAAMTQVVNFLKRKQTESGEITEEEEVKASGNRTGEIEESPETKLVKSQTGEESSEKELAVGRRRAIRGGRLRRRRGRFFV